jgi:hypothetical protein
MVLLAVIAAHLAVIYFAIHATPTLKFSASNPHEQIILVYLPRPAPVAGRASPVVQNPTPNRQPTKPNRAHSAAHNNDPDSPLISIPPAEPPPPMIDWEKEAALAAQNSIKPDGYRNLSGLSPEQLKWISDNQFAPEPAGIVWKRPVLDHTPDGLLIIHLGERCVIVPPLPMVFCKIGWMH